MKISTITIILLLNASTLFGQITNSGFETQNDSIATLPNNWYFKKIDGYKASTDPNFKFEGQKSLKIGSTDGDLNKFMPFSQIVELNVPQLKKVTITAYIKTEEIVGNATVWCQIWDKDKNQIGFNSLQVQNVLIDKTNDWKKYSLEMVLNTNCKKLLLGGLLNGKGTVWFDQFSIEEANSSSVPPSKKAKKQIDKFCKIIRENSIVSDSLNWEEINKDIAFLSSNMKTKSDARPVLDYVVNKLKEKGDFHSFLMNPNISRSYGNQKYEAPQPESKTIDGKIGYISVPGFSGSGPESYQFANKIQQLIRQLDSANQIKGWIVDLRSNTGGNMYPMISGLSPLLQNGTLGYFVNPKNNLKEKWQIQDGAISSGNQVIMKIGDSYHLKNNNLKIAVLIGPSTASSGEMTTISFIGNPNTKLFGQPSAGFTTANKGFMLSKELMIQLAVSYVSDRNGKEYLRTIAPEVVVDEKDDILKIASQWLIE